MAKKKSKVKSNFKNKIIFLLLWNIDINIVFTFLLIESKCRIKLRACFQHVQMEI